MVVGVVAIDVPDERFEWFVLFRTPGDIGCCCWFSGGDVAPAVVPLIQQYNSLLELFDINFFNVQIKR